MLLVSRCFRLVGRLCIEAIVNVMLRLLFTGLRPLQLEF